jgi:hypothetical protein
VKTKPQIWLVVYSACLYVQNYRYIYSLLARLEYLEEGGCLINGPKCDIEMMIFEQTDLFTKFHEQMLTKGIMLDENNSEPMYTYAAHNENDLKHILEAFELSLPT